MTLDDAPTGPTLDEIRTWPATVGVTDACRALGLSKSWGYQLINEGAWPCKTITIRGRTRVVTASLIALLSADE